MYAKNLENLLAKLCRETDVSVQDDRAMAQRFESLRDYNRLPRGRQNRERVLTLQQIAYAILGLVPVTPGFSGHAAIVLAGLKPVGGKSAGFNNCESLLATLVELLNVADGYLGSIRLMLSAAGSAANSHCVAKLELGETECSRDIWFIHQNAVSQFQPGAEREFNPDNYIAQCGRQMTFNKRFFVQIARKIEEFRQHPPPLVSDGSEYDDEEARQARLEKLGVKRDSQYLHIGVDNQVTWPKEETLVTFDKYQLVLFPKTKDHVQSVHIDLNANRLSMQEAQTVINRFLSILSWCDDQYAVAQGGWGGSPIPVAVDKRNLAFATAHQWVFDRKMPTSPGVKRALAIYRDGRNAEQNSLVSYAVLNYFKIIEIRHKGKEKCKKWIADNFDTVADAHSYEDAFEAIREKSGVGGPQKYLYEECRNAVAHAGLDQNSDPDEADELRRLHEVAAVMRLLARHLILQEMGVSDCYYSGE
jgi:hypothetical protein